MIKQRVSEAVEKVKRQSAEEKQRLVLEANTKLRDAVSAARSELEGRMAQAQALAVQEALKEANTQGSSKEVSSYYIVKASSQCDARPCVALTCEMQKFLIKKFQ